MDSSPSHPAPSVDGLSAEKLLASALHGAPVSSPAFGWEPPAPAEVAPWFPEYEVLALAGRGAMGAVYRAVQRKFDRPVAIKLLPAGLAAREGVVPRFEREARTMAQLNHPNIVSIYDYGRTEQGHLFIVMEYVEGADLSRLIHSTGLQVSQALEIVTQVCDALQYAHSRGFVHRDIKPGNVLVNTGGRVKIADFGLAKLLSTDAPDPNATLTGTVVGTPDYTAPEQLKGESVDHRADIYSLGVMFYEMLTGDLPRGAWEPPSRRTAEAGAGLDEIVTRAMQSIPDKRYQQASEVKAAVEAAGRRVPEPGPLPPSAVRRRDTLAFILPAVVGAAGVALIYSHQEFSVAGIVFCGLAVSLFLEMCLQKRAAAIGALASTFLGALLPHDVWSSLGSFTLNPFFATLIVGTLWLRYRTLVTLVTLTCLICATALKQEANRRERVGTADMPANRPAKEVKAPEPSERALQDIDAAINELADAQEAFDHYGKEGIARYWTEEEQNRQTAWLTQLTGKCRTRAAVLPEGHAKRVEAEKRVGSIKSAHNAMKLPAVSPETCVYATFRNGGGNTEYFEGQELVPGLRAWSWLGRNDSDRWVYYLETPREAAPPQTAAPAEKGSLEYYPEFWALDVPVEPLQLPPSGPQSNAELEWIIKQFPKETAADSAGLVVAEFEAAGDPQLRWRHWSRSIEDLIPWAEGHPHVSGGASKGRIIVRAGKCYTVFDDIPRPRLCGDNGGRAIVWAARRIMQEEISTAGGEWMKGKSVEGPAVAQNIQRITGQYSEYTARDCAIYSREIAESHRPWGAWQRDRDHLEDLLRINAGKQANNEIPFQHAGGMRVLATRLVCSRGIAEKLAVAFKADLPRPADQTELDALAALLPPDSVAHCGAISQSAGVMKRWPGSEAAPAGELLTIQAGKDEGSLRSGRSRALLLLAWPEEEPSRKGRKAVPP